MRLDLNVNLRELFPLEFKMKLTCLPKKNRGLYLITDTIISSLSHTQITRQAIQAGIKIIQLREKSMSKKELFKEAVSIRALTKKK